MGVTAYKAGSEALPSRKPVLKLMCWTVDFFEGFLVCLSRFGLFEAVAFSAVWTDIQEASRVKNVRTCSLL
jgi:hypothetical protein